MKTDVKHFPITAQVTVDLTQQDIDDIMVGALEGGITYWCSEAEVVGEYLGKYGSDQISRNGKLILHDAESDDTWELTLEKFLQGFKMYLEHSGAMCLLNGDGAVDTGLIDGDAADSIVQYALFGDLVFG